MMTTAVRFRNARTRPCSPTLLLLLLLQLAVSVLWGWGRGHYHSFPVTLALVGPLVTRTTTTITRRTTGRNTALGVSSDAKRSTSSTTTASSSSPSSSMSPKEILFDLILNQTPAGRATSEQLTQRILQQIQSLSCPTPDEKVLEALSGSWELLWTAQDPSQPETQRWSNRILNPIENQSFSNNPEGANGSNNSNNNNNNNMGRSNPFLPMGVQNALEQWGIVSTTPSATTRRSTQAIDIHTRTIRNIVSIQFRPNSAVPKNQHQQHHPNNDATTPSSSSASPPRRVALTVTVKFTPVRSDARRVNVKFTECRVSLPTFISSSSSSSSKYQQPNQLTKPKNNLEYTFPLGLFGPTGWLRTIYIDDTLRITRGHKGSVFVLARPRRATV